MVDQKLGNQVQGSSEYKKMNPSTKNGLESIDATIKKGHTLRQRLALALFLKVMILLEHGQLIEIHKEEITSL
jgi:hypothetical protein